MTAMKRLILLLVELDPDFAESVGSTSMRLSDAVCGSTHAEITDQDDNVTRVAEPN